MVHPYLSASRPLRVIFFRTAAGTEPVRDWLKKLPKEYRRKIGEDIMTVQFRWPLGMPIVPPLDDKIKEIRTGLTGHTARILFFVHEEIIVLLHGFLKKTCHTPIDDLALAKKRNFDYPSCHEK